MLISLYRVCVLETNTCSKNNVFSPENCNLYLKRNKSEMKTVWNTNYVFLFINTLLLGNPKQVKNLGVNHAKLSMYRPLLKKVDRKK